MFAEVTQYVLNGLVLGALISLPALGLTLIFSVQGFVNFSVAAQMTVGAYAAWMAGSYLGWSPIPMLVLAFAIPGLLGIVADRVALAPIRHRSSGQTALMLAVVSIALNLAIENGLRFIFGSNLNSFDLPIERDLRVWGLVLVAAVAQPRHGFGHRGRPRRVLLSYALGESDESRRR